tara:strand:- start:46324 stop:47283 length:960 start_codon:yes stop_codon:yes gene_type:complete
MPKIIMKFSLLKNQTSKIWLLRHAQNAISSLGRLKRNFTSTIMTTSVIGIALALPGGLYLAIDSLRVVGNNWNNGPSISAFLRKDVSDEDAEEVSKEILNIEGVAKTRLITREEALNEFREVSGFREALDLLSSNPLPVVIVVEPKKNYTDTNQIKKIATSLNKIIKIDLVQYDTQWIERLHAIIKIIERVIYILAFILCIAIFLIIGNTIRLEILNRYDEIKIIRLVGGSDAFVRRPFLYEGFWYGIIGALIAIILMYLSIFLINSPVESLLNLYNSNFQFQANSSIVFWCILAGSPILGLLSSWLAVSQHLKKMRPS